MVPMTRRFVVRLLARLDASPLPMTDPVRLELEAELIALLVKLSPYVRGQTIGTPVNVAHRGEA